MNYCKGWEGLNTRCGWVWWFEAEGVSTFCALLCTFIHLGTVFCVHVRFVKVKIVYEQAQNLCYEQIASFCIICVGNSCFKKQVLLQN